MSTSQGHGSHAADGKRPGNVTAIAGIELAFGLLGLGLAWLAQRGGAPPLAIATLAVLSLARLWIGTGLLGGKDDARLTLSWLAGLTLVAQFFVAACWIVRGAPWGDLLPRSAGVAAIAFHILYAWLVLWHLSGPPAFEWFRARRT